jgi:RNA polymerase sigma-70 factor (ECF subfamily)
MVYGTALGVLRNDADAEDVCQEAFMQAMRKIDSLHKPCHFSGWLRRIARNKAINKKRSKKRESRWTNDFSCVFGQQAAPDANILANEEQTRVRQALRRLTRVDRELLVAFYFHGYSLPEIGRQLRRPTGTIKRRIHVARKRLAQEMGSAGASRERAGAASAYAGQTQDTQTDVLSNVPATGGDKFVLGGVACWERGMRLAIAFDWISGPTT